MIVTSSATNISQLNRSCIADDKASVNHDSSRNDRTNRLYNTCLMISNAPKPENAEEEDRSLSSNGVIKDQTHICGQVGLVCK